MSDQLDQLCQLDLAAASLLPCHPTLTNPRTGEPLRAVGHRRDGRAIWPILGAADDDTDDDDDDDDDKSKSKSKSKKSDDDEDDDDDDDDEDDDDDKPLGPKGEKALQAEKEKRRRARAAQRKAEEDLVAAQAEVARLKKAGSKKKSDDTDDDDEDDDTDRRDRARRDREEADARANAKIVKAEAKAIAADLGFKDPDDAVRYVDPADYEVDEDGDLEDPDDLRDALADMLKRKPYLKGKGKRFGGSADGGPQGEGKKVEPQPGTDRIRAAYADNARRGRRARAAQ